MSRWKAGKISRCSRSTRGRKTLATSWLPRRSRPWSLYPKDRSSRSVFFRMRPLSPRVRREQLEESQAAAMDPELRTPTVSATSKNRFPMQTAREGRTEFIELFRLGVLMDDEQPLKGQGGGRG